ncbi:hypothetical protein BKA62DRAFT_57120 [Auriculariales sp. MPI-PUGE-AT-0066]|nr:hypothetical protein BKA62DRAFT_57120 [Auriculariales sp. MPI-PUGE-AT-0066]
MQSYGLPPGAAPSSTVAMSLSSTAEALYFATKPVTVSPNEAGLASHWDDSDDDPGRVRPQSPDSAYSSSAPNSRRESRTPQSQPLTPLRSQSRFSDEDNSDDDRYGPPDGEDNRDGSSSTVPGTGDFLDAVSFLDDRPEHFYRQSAREAEAYRYLAARRPSPRPEELNLSAAKSPSAVLAVSQSPTGSPTLPLNIKKKSPSPASPNFAPRHFAPDPHAGTIATPILSSRFDTPSTVSSSGDRLSNSDGQGGARQSVSSVTSNSNSAPLQRASTASQPISNSSRASRAASVSRQLSTELLSPRLSQAPPLPQHENNSSSDEHVAAGGSDSDGDNVPLAQRIPGALKAQQSIRAKDKEDRLKRRADRAARKAELAAAATLIANTRPINGQALANTDGLRSGSVPKNAAPIASQQTIPPQPGFADDLSRRLAKVQSPDERPQSDTFAKPRAFPNDAQMHLLRNKLSQPNMKAPSRQNSTDFNVGSGVAKEFRPPSQSGDADPDARMRAYAANVAATVSSGGGHSRRVSLTRRISGSLGFGVSKSRPPSPPRVHPPARQQTMPSASPKIPIASASRPPSPQPRRSTASSGRRDRNGTSVSRPGSPVMRPPSPSMGTMTPDERLRQAAMSRGSRSRAPSVSAGHASRPAMPSFEPPMPNPTPAQRQEISSPRPSYQRAFSSEQDRPALASPRLPPSAAIRAESSVAASAQGIESPVKNTIPMPMAPPSSSMMDSTLTPDERLRQIALSRANGSMQPVQPVQMAMAPPPAVVMDSTLSPDERLRQIAMSRAQHSPPVPPANAGGFRKRAMSLGRPSKDDLMASASGQQQPTRSKTLVRARPAAAAPPVPAMPTLKGEHSKPCVIHSAGSYKSVSVEVKPSMRAREVVAQVQGQLSSGAGAHGWMLWEVCNDLNLERPIREYEIPLEASARWSSEGNTFVIRQTRLASYLAQSAVPGSSPGHSSWVEFEVKKGKWNKRWLELRENNLWVSKRDNGKDAAFLCSLSNFDVYTNVRPQHKPPKYGFTLRSTDDLSMFENPADSLHCFCALDAREGERWIERIMVARSCVLAQERTALFKLPPQQAVSASTTAVQLPRRQPTISQPLVSARSLQQPPGLTSPITPNSRAVGGGAGGGPFEPGSLLARAVAGERT